MGHVVRYEVVSGEQARDIWIICRLHYFLALNIQSVNNLGNVYQKVHCFAFAQQDFLSRLSKYLSPIVLINTVL